VKRGSSRILLAVITTFIMVTVFTPCAHACIDAKFIWNPPTYPPVFSVGDTVTFNASSSTLNWISTIQEYVPLVSVKWNFGDGNTEDYYGYATLSSPLWTWTFGDGNISEGMVITHVFTKPGTYDVTLTITDAGGDPPSDTWTIPLTANASSTVKGGSDGFPWWIAVVVVAAGIGIVLPVYFIKVRKPK
jgi:hypothetical protein